MNKAREGVNWIFKNLTHIIIRRSIQMAPAIVEPYNAILSTHTSLESVDVCFLVDNQVKQ